MIVIVGVAVPTLLAALALPRLRLASHITATAGVPAPEAGEPALTPEPLLQEE